MVTAIIEAVAGFLKFLPELFKMFKTTPEQKVQKMRDDLAKKKDDAEKTGRPK